MLRPARRAEQRVFSGVSSCYVSRSVLVLLRASLGRPLVVVDLLSWGYLLCRSSLRQPIRRARSHVGASVSVLPMPHPWLGSRPSAVSVVLLRTERRRSRYSVLIFVEEAIESVRVVPAASGNRVATPVVHDLQRHAVNR